eukprot:Nk52_evm59s78 gene=Nk52_evmTU59s78
MTMDIVTVFVTSSVNTFSSERRYDKATTIGKLKEKLELITGASFANMKLQLFSDKDVLLCDMNEDERPIGFYPVQEFYRIHVIDTNPYVQKGEFEDTSRVEKMEMTEEEYANKQDTVRAFKMRNKMGRFADDYEEKKKAKEDAEAELASKINVGERCEIAVKGAPTRRGTVMYVGKTSFKDGSWVGVQYDEPVGKNDGSVEGKKYFSCPPKFGGFVKPSAVTVGDFPEEELFSDDEM